MKLIFKFLFFTFCLFCISSINASTNDNVVVEQSPYLISIEQIKVTEMIFTDTIDVSIVTDKATLAGFDLKIACNPRYLDIIDVLAGELYDSCRWDFFNARQGGNPTDKKIPFTIWQIVALADMTVDDKKPLCFSLDKKSTLVRLVITNQFLKEVPDTVVPIFFLWEDCTDNTISSISGNSLNLSNRVIEYYKIIPMLEGDPFPSSEGTSGNCIKTNSINKPKRNIDFHCGGVVFELDVGLDSSDTAK